MNISLGRLSSGKFDTKIADDDLGFLNDGGLRAVWLGRKFVEQC